MNDSIKRITLEVQNTTSKEYVNVKKSDTRRTLLVSLTDGGFPYHITPDCYAVFSATKSDGNKIFNTCLIVNDCVVYRLTPQTLSATGTSKCEIKIYGDDDGLITSAAFNMVVSESENDGDDIVSEDEVNALTHLISEATEAINEVNEAISEATEVTNETNETNEQARSLYEQIGERLSRFDANMDLVEQAVPLANSVLEEAPTIYSRAQQVEDMHSEVIASEERIRGYEESVSTGVPVAEEAARVAVEAKESANTAAREINDMVKEFDFKDQVARIEKNTEDIEVLSEKVADLLYDEIKITSISHNAGTKEMGDTVTAVTVSWMLSKDPKTQKLNDESLDPAIRSKSFTGLNITTNSASADKTFTLNVTDERDFPAKKSASISFVNGLFYGLIDDGTEITSELLITSLTKLLQASKGCSFTVDPPTDKRVIFALPTRLGDPKFTSGGFPMDMYKAETFQFTNSKGYEESYTVWLSTELQNNSNGAIPIVVA